MTEAAKKVCEIIKKEAIRANSVLVPRNESCRNRKKENKAQLLEQYNNRTLENYNRYKRERKK